ncbi:MAG TPA: hypothetical protein PLO59_01395, partial [Bacteroidia bacterium]|nr:hypothetical protein [Bacteroidia bacterium]
MNRLVLQLFRITAFLLLVNVINAGAQVSKKAHKRIAKLTSEKFFGRGYVKGGDSIAADYLAKQFKQTGLLPIDANYFQKFTFSVNTFPNQIFVNIAGKALKPGYDFIVEAASGRADVTCKLFNVTDSVLPLPQSECAYVISKKYFTTASNKTALKNWLLT